MMRASTEDLPIRPDSSKARRGANAPSTIAGESLVLTFAIGLLLVILLVAAAWAPSSSFDVQLPRPCQPSLVVSLDGARFSLG
jgi:hypothetical protein